MPEGLPDGWRLVRLDQLGTIERGRSRHRPRNDPSLYGGKYPFVQTGDVKAAGLHLYEYTQTYNDAGLAQSRIWPPGTLCITIAANICETSILGVSACFPDSIIGFTPHPDRSDVVFVKYVLDQAKQRFAGISRGATQDNLSQEKLLSQLIAVPPLRDQRRIASILGAYDDLIEVNRRRIAVLEEMARRLFEEWFVHFRFPGHEGHGFVDTERGLLPHGWASKRLDQVCRSVDDGDWIETKDQGGSDYRLIQISNIGLGRFVETNNYRFVTKDTFVRLRCNEIVPDDLLVARMPDPIGRAWLAVSMPWKMITSVDVAIVRADRRRLNPFFLLYLWNHPENLKRIAAQSSGTTRLRVTRRQLSALEFVVPDINFQQKFADVIEPQAMMIGTLSRQMEKLAASRDLLLPRLISGELSVAAAERELEAAE